ncbi:proto-oncogene vav-like [Acipenser oxyrinchus oxyrinchus]|uniref:Osteoclast-stimulating factor 1 n=1 Tax=Acipenser oxyrinchus oxyrinchus TaxID=40147 RepID=A0AAD8FU62_ACIOX|nr:proto-oncogene vav-like [Acipenser oxyrinchus oxyrinchus]KAK1153976.1 proto-oncogene vav-like [Acipenser oxyrinchus oxyrinchus]
MELWRQCAHWLIQCRVLPENHRVTWDSATVGDLAHALRDGVLLCQLLNNLQPQSINLKEINLRPQMSQFLCLKNIRTFLSACLDQFGMKKSELFEAFDLFDVRDFAKVIEALSSLSYTAIAQSRGVSPFPTEDSVPDDEIYSGLSDHIDDTGEEDDDLYDCVDDENNEGDEIYEDLMRHDAPAGTQQKITEVDKRQCCLQEIRQTEEKYTETLGSILNHFMKPLQRFLQPSDIESIFINIEELYQTHSSLLEEVRSSILTFNADNLYQVFIKYKKRLLLYGAYCSQVESSSKHLDKVANMREDVRMKLEECSKRANNGRFTLRDLLMVPMQRVLKYHLLLQELVKHTTDATDKDNLRTALDAMRDLAQCVNEVKRDNEILRQITSFQLSIENMTQSLALYGRPKIDGELKICVDKRKQDRYAFLFDKAMLVCKKKTSECMELKETIELQHYQLRDDSSGDKKWSHLFVLIDTYGQQSYDLYFKTKELKKKWLEQFEMAMSNMYPENSTANSHDFQMNSFEETTSCKACQMLLRGIFFQGYRCTRCKVAAHKECLGRVAACGRHSDLSGTLKKSKNNRATVHRPNEPGLPKMEVSQEYYGMPPPPVAFGQPLRLALGDIIELTKAEVDQPWWEGRNICTNEVGWFPCSKVRPFVSRLPPDLTMYPWFAGNMERSGAETLLSTRSDGTYLVRQRQKDAGEYAISIKFNVEIKHIKVTTSSGLFQINEKKAFKGLIELVEFYQRNTLKECFKALDTTLQFPFQEPEQQTVARSPAGSVRYYGTARARYDFSARDRLELSMREGDVIKIISKKGQQGWWKGEIYGRVGLFPANYVEEDYSDYC